MDNKETKFCKYCGAKISIDSAFCENCGKKLETSTENITQSEPKKDEPFHWSDDDIHKPKAITKRCRTCGAIIDEKLQFCPNCRASQYSVVPADLKKCKYCGADMAATFKTCPHCGKRVKNYTAAYICLGILGFMFLCMIIAALVPDSKTTDTAEKLQRAKQNAATENAVPTPTLEPKDKELDLYSDSNVNIKYMKLFDQSEILKGTLYLQLRVTNNSSNTVIVRLEDVSVNKMTVTSGTAVPIKIEPGNMSVSPFILFAGNTGIVKADEVHNIRFKLEMLDEDFRTLHTTTTVNVDL